MSQNFNQTDVQSALGYYFKTPDLLSAAFTPAKENSTEGNGGLVFLGERLFDFVISDYLFAHYPFSEEKELLRRLGETKKALDCQSFISEKGLSRYIRLSGKNESLREDKALHGEIFLSVLAAMYKDGGLPSLKAFLLPLLRAADKQEHYPPKRNEGAGSSAETSFESKRRVEADITSAVIKEEKRAKTEKLEKDDRKKAFEENPTAKAKKESKIEKKSPEKTDEKSGKLGAGLLKAIRLPSMRGKKDTEMEAKKPEEERNDDKKDSAEEPRRSFIRDALAPVSLPESMRNPKPKKTYVTSSETTAEEMPKAKLPEKSYTDDGENYKSLLQEYVQKNLRSANVLLKYDTVRKGNVFVTEITLDGKSLAKADGSVKKTSEKEAAKIAYEELNSLKSPLASWFSSVCAQGLNVQKAPDNYISRLNEYYQKKSHSSSAPLTYEPRPSREKKTFSVAIVFNGEELAVGTAHTVKDAKQDAARQVCEKIKI